MTPELIQRLIALVQKHGDRVVLADPSVGSRAVVVLDLDEYERLRDGATGAQRTLPLASPTPASPVAVSVAASVPAPASPVQAPTSAPAPTPAPSSALDLSSFDFEKPAKKPVSKPNFAPETPGIHDLTQEELIAKINRDIGAWKTAQDRKRTDELKSAVAPEAAPLQTSPGLEEEERFFLEPIE